MGDAKSVTEPNDLKLFDIEQTLSANKLHKVLNPFKLQFDFLSIFGLKRFSFNNGEIHPPSPVSKVYSLAAVVCILIYDYQQTTKINTLSEEIHWKKHIKDKGEEVYFLVITATFGSIIISNLLDPFVTKEIFEVLMMVDEDLNIPDGHGLFKLTSSRIRAHLIIETISYASLYLMSMFTDFTVISNLPTCISTCLLELELLFCCLFLGYIEINFLYIIAHMKYKFAHKSSGVSKNGFFFFLFSQRPSFELTAETVTFDVNVTTLYKVYGRLLEAFKLINRLFRFQVLMYLLINFINSMGSVYAMIYEAETEISKPVIFYITVGLWWERISICIIYLCLQIDRLSIAVEDFECAILNVLEDPTLEDLHESARNLLHYCEVNRPKFDVFYLFEVDINLPFYFVSLVGTYVIVLLQFTL